MPKITNVRPVILSSPYADQVHDTEVHCHLKQGYRICGMVEITLDDGTTGLGEGYVAVFAPHIFKELLSLYTPVLLGREIMDFNNIYRDLWKTSGYWSYQGAARHALSAVEIAIHDCRSKYLGIPVYELFGGAFSNSIEVYGSGGDSGTPAGGLIEFDYLEKLKINHFKIRAQTNQVNKAVWYLKEGKKRGIDIAIDMVQSMSIPSNSVSEVVHFLDEVSSRTDSKILFLEEALGPTDGDGFKMLRMKVDTKVAGGEIITTASELSQQIQKGAYDIVQPDGTVIGGISEVLEVFSTANRFGCEVIVHCWGGPVGMMANFHAALAGGGKMVEWPMKPFPIREAMMVEPWNIKNGILTIGKMPGLGITLTEEIEQEFSFREDAVYNCAADMSIVPPDSVWLE